MKKLLALCMSLFMVLSLCACGSDVPSDIQKQVDDKFADADGSLDGGWKKADSSKITEDEQAVFDQATGELVGCGYEAVEMVATQVVAGTNYCFLAKLTPVVPDAESYYALVYIYEDLSGNVTLDEVEELDND